uniref:Uncharacterized protein n=1 Tax=Magnetococcus massalia (strain MO-1) TaxID=451514 RepID=A0A1S7LF37_MAGMO|nr:conserved protein of unknown function [Candidatus Magnetococcus massalia]
MRTFLSIDNSELNLLAFAQSAETFTLNGTEVNENVTTLLTGDETKTLLLIEEFDGTYDAF